MMPFLCGRCECLHTFHVFEKSSCFKAFNSPADLWVTGTLVSMSHRHEHAKLNEFVFVMQPGACLSFSLTQVEHNCSLPRDRLLQQKYFNQPTLKKLRLLVSSSTRDHNVSIPYCPTSHCSHARRSWAPRSSGKMD